MDGSMNLTHDVTKALLVGSDDGDLQSVQNLILQSPGSRTKIELIHDFDKAEYAMATGGYDVCLLCEGIGQARGVDLLCRTLVVRQDLPILFLAHQEDYDLDVEVTQAGALDFLVIDRITPHAIERSIRRAIESKRTEMARLRAQSDLQVSDKRYESIVANVPGMVYRATCKPNESIQFNYASEGCIDLFGVEPFSVVTNANALLLMIHPDDREAFEGAWKNLVPPNPWRWQGRFVLLSGVEKIVNGYGTPEVLSDGSIVWEGLMIDVSERVRAERRSAQLAAIVQGSENAILGKTLEGIVTNWNAAAEKLYGYTAAEIVGKSVGMLFPPDRNHDLAEILRKIANNEKIGAFETVRVAKDGTMIEVSLTISPMIDIDGRVTGASTITHDIRERKQIEKQITRQIERIQALRNIDMAITGSLDLRVTLNVLLDQVTSHLKVDAAAVLLLNSHTRRLEYCIGRGFRNPNIQRSNLRLGEGTAGKAALERRVIAIGDFSCDPNDFVRTAVIAEEGFASYWAAPLVTKGHVVGVLELYHRSPFHGDDDWLNFLETLGGQAAIAIENADLFNDLQRSNEELQIAYDSTLEGWSKALDLRDRETEGHTIRVTEKTAELAKKMGIPDVELTQIRRGSLLHDIGKMGIPDAILLKPGPLSEEEWAIMKRHPVYAYELLAPIAFLRQALDIPYCHHERWDGRGYPRGLKGEQIPLSARIFSVVDVWDALMSDRPYRKAWSPDEVHNYLREGIGTQFDPVVIDAFFACER
jgi:PAS domain S-box-containing protein